MLQKIIVPYYVNNCGGHLTTIRPQRTINLLIFYCLGSSKSKECFEILRQTVPPPKQPGLGVKGIE